MKDKNKKQPGKKEEICGQLSEQQVRDLARYIIGELESATDISRGTERRKKRILPPPASVMIF